MKTGKSISANIAGALALAAASILACGCACANSAGVAAQETARAGGGAAFNVCQFNMRYGLENDGKVVARETLPNGKVKITYDGTETWEKRFPLIRNFLRYNEIDICGTQELSWFQVESFDEMKEFGYIGVPTFPEKYAQKIPGANNIILFRKDRFEVLGQGCFWFSDTPEKVSSGFGADKPRNCNWGKFRDKITGAEFYFFNMHFHHRGDKTRIESAKLLVKKVAEIAGGGTFITTGDLNCREDSDAFRHIKNSGFMIDAREVCKTPVYGPGWTNNFGYTGVEILKYPAISGKPRDQGWIDWVFVSKNVEIFKFGVIPECHNGVWLSDHFPLVLKAAIK